MSNSIQKLIALEPRLSTGSYGEWAKSAGHAGTREDSHVVFGVKYNAAVNEYIDLVHQAVEECPDYDLYSYHEILHKNGLDWGETSLSQADVSDKDTQCILAMLLSIARAERFSDGMLLHFLKEGHIQRWLRRLKELES